MKMPQISILGCGWLGLPLGISLTKKGFKVNGSSTSENKLDTLSNSGINPFLISLSEEKTEGEINRFLRNSEILIIDIPPQMRKDASEKFSNKIKTLIPHIAESNVKNVLFVSSTSVFGKEQGRVNESTTPLPDSLTGKDLLLTEKLLQENSHFKTTILRFGGLTGPERHPVKYLAGRKNIAEPNSVVNIIHQNDCIGIIERIIEKEAWGKVYHGVNPMHPTRQEYYSAKAKEFGLPIPQFENNTANPSEGKLVESQLTIQELDYEFKEDV